MRYEAPRVARVAQGYGPSLRFCKNGRFHGRAFQRLHSAQAPAVVSASDAALRGGGSARRNLDQPIAEQSAARIAGARNVPVVGSGQSELAARPEGNFSWLQGLEKSRNGEGISPSARGRGRPSEHLRRAHPRGLPSRLPKPLQSPCRGSTRKGVADTAGAVAHLFPAPFASKRRAISSAISHRRCNRERQPPVRYRRRRAPSPSPPYNASPRPGSDSRSRGEIRASPRGGYLRSTDGRRR